MRAAAATCVLLVVLAVPFFELFPAFVEYRAFIVKADKEYFAPPAQSVTYMDGRYTTAVKLFFAVGAVMYFIKVFFTGI